METEKATPQIDFNNVGLEQGEHRPHDRSGTNTQHTSMSPQNFASVFGQAVWLASLSPDYAKLSVSEAVERFALPITRRQFRLFSKGQQPIAFLTFASASDDVKAAIEAGKRDLAPEDWISGPEVTVVDCISPFNPTSQFLESFERSVNQALKTSLEGVSS